MSDASSMDATARRPAGPAQAKPAEPPLSDQTRASHGSVVEDSYLEDRSARLRRGRLIGFALCIPLWALSVVPLAREFTDGREGAGRVLVVLAAAAFSLAVAGAIRGIYTVLMRRRFWSPWLFPLAALVAIVGYTVQSAGEEQISFESALAVGESLSHARESSPIS